MEQSKSIKWTYIAIKIINKHAIENLKEAIETYGQDNERTMSAMVGLGLIQLFKTGFKYLTFVRI
jgi:hypothetical protein